MTRAIIEPKKILSKSKSIASKTKLIKPLNAIVIGDVGSGKTIVAFLIAISFLRSKLDLGHPESVAMLAPTEVLAMQHYLKLLEFRNSRPELSFLTIIFRAGKQYYINDDSYTPAKFQKALDAIKLESKEFFWVGTHALLWEENLEEEFVPGLVMVDEQHRFGVKQRQKLNSAGQTSHFLSFTATPIPRTLALSMYDSLDTFWLQKLGSRLPINTRITTFEKWSEINNTIQKHLDNNHKVYIICPLVEKSEEKNSTPKKEELKSVQETLEHIEKTFSSQVLSVHGKIKDKQAILTEFKTSKNKNILVATTVVEVGVDVGEATLMIVLNAERFGLSALHQIRGRIGRNDYSDNECLLVTQPQMVSSRRLNSLVQHQDGFQLSKIDLDIRGGGDIIGTTQSGFASDLQILSRLGEDKFRQLIGLVNYAKNSLDSLPRLKAYCEKQAKEIWSE
jgi:ATP-dependent DNA helicase RecG